MTGLSLLGSRRVLVAGPPGSGKTAFSIRLASMVGLEYIGLDALRFAPDGALRTDREFQDRLHLLMQQDNWIMDGNYPLYFRFELERPDTIILLDRPVGLCIARVLKRGWKRPANHQGRQRAASSGGGQRTAGVRHFGLFRRLRNVNYRLYWDLINFPRLYRPMMLNNLRDWTGGRLIILRKEAEVAAFWSEQSLLFSRQAGANGIQ